MIKYKKEHMVYMEYNSMNYEEIVKTEDVPETDNKLLKTAVRALLGALAVTVIGELLDLNKK